MMEVRLGQAFRSEFLNFPTSDKLLISKFIRHIEQYGFENLLGRNKFSDDIRNDDPQFRVKLDKVRKYNLWHYHIGITRYTRSSIGDMVSEYVLHYIKDIDHIKIVDLGSHPPFRLPLDEYLK